jgi:hypothetical protein
MRNATFGTFKDGQIIFDEPDVPCNNARVLVVFLDEEPGEPQLLDLFRLYGPWEDTRGVEDIVADLRNSRIAKADVAL